MQIAMPPPGQEVPRLSLRGPILFGLLAIIVFLVSFGAWAALSPLDSAAIAPGVVNASSNRKTIKHLEGGIVATINVHEGQVVEAGDVLVALDRTRPRAELAITRDRLATEMARIGRLQAERDDKPVVEQPEGYGKVISDDLVQRLIVGQQIELDARRKFVADRVAILRQQIAQFVTEKEGLERQIRSQRSEISLLQDELVGLESLFARELIGMSRVRELQRDVERLQGGIHGNRSAIGRADQSIGEIELQIEELRSGNLSQTLEQLQESEDLVRELRERIAALQDVLRRTDIIAPLSGVIVGLNVFTSGGVIAPGEPLMDIVPTDDGIVIEARVDPVDIDVVTAGLEARVRFSSFNQRDIQPSPARVLTVSADRLTDERSGADYFLARVALDDEVLENLGQSVTPGMPAEVLIITGERTPWQYLIDPIARSFDRAFRES